MEVVKKPEILLSNYEVLSLLKEVTLSEKGRQDTRKKQSKSNLATIVYETTKYLQDLTRIQDDDTFKDLLIKLKAFNLTKSEKLDIVNHLPTSLVELQLMIEDSEERFSEETMQDILETTSSFTGQEDTQSAKQEDFEESEEEHVMNVKEDDAVTAESIESVEVSAPFSVKSESQ